MPKPTLDVFIGDGHGGSDTGLCVPGYMMGIGDDEKKRPYSPSRRQLKLHTAFVRMVGDVKTMAKGHRLCVKFGGDMVDGAGHHGTTQTAGNNDDQIQMMAELLMPLVNAADDVKGATGTEAHVGSVGDRDATLYRELGAKCDTVWNLVEDGRRLWWAHHGIRVGLRDWTRENGAVMMAKDIEIWSMRYGKPKPDLVVAHHAHQTFDPVTVRGITLAVCPCWQLPTYYIDSIAPFSAPSIGILTWKPSTNETKIIPYKLR